MIDIYMLGFLDMERKLLFQEELFQNLITSAQTGVSANSSLLFAEHPHCFSIHKESDLQFVKDCSLFERITKDRGVRVIKMHRGGSLTYHGPGQLVVSPVLNLTACGMQNVEDYFKLLEDVCIMALREYGIMGIAGMEGNARGVWVRDSRWKVEPERKIVSLGACCRMVQMAATHIVSGGFSLNVATDLSYFSLIHPCGLVGRKATSMDEILGYRPSFADIQEMVLRLLAKALSTKSPHNNVRTFLIETFRKLLKNGIHELFGNCLSESTC